LKRAILIATITATAFAVPASLASAAANPPQQGCPASNLTLFSGKDGGLGAGLHAIATPGTPGGVGQAVQAFCAIP
jgi:hypothetical protein